MSTLKRAVEIAVTAHARQTDKLRQPYILHPLRVMRAVEGLEDRIVAVLHDVVEDCPDWPLERLAAEGFSGSVVDAIDALTKREGETYEAFIARGEVNPMARRVKLADIRDNTDPDRMKQLSPGDRDRLVRKYEVAIRVLTKVT